MPISLKERLWHWRFLSDWKWLILIGYSWSILPDANMLSKWKRDVLQEQTVKMEHALKKLQDKEDLIVTLTESPSFETYQKLVQENQQLRKELSAKDQIIARLQDELKKVRKIAAQWKEKFHELAHKLGSRVMDALGIDHTQDTSLREYPAKEVTSTVVSLQKETAGIDLKNCRIIPDPDNEGKFRVASRTLSGEYETVRGCFDSRSHAEEWKRTATEQNRNMEHMSNTRGIS